MNVPQVNVPQSGAELRKLVRRAIRERADAPWYELFTHAYAVILTAVILVSMLVPALSDTATTLPAEATGRGPVAVIVLVAGLALGHYVAEKLGPLSASAPVSVWLLPVPLDRRGLLWPRAFVALVVAGLWGSVVGLLSAALWLAQDGGLEKWLYPVAAAASAQMLLLAMAFREQSIRPGGGSWVHTLLTRGVIIAVAVLGAAEAVQADAINAVHWFLPAALSFFASGLWSLGVLEIDRIPTANLLTSSQRAAGAAAAVADLNLRHLLLNLAEPYTARFARQSSWLGWVRGPASGVVVANWLMFIRSPRYVAQVVGSALVVWLAAYYAPSRPVLAIVVTGCVHVAALSVCAGARHADDVPQWEREFACPAATTRRLMLVVPAAVMLVWGLVAGLGLALGLALGLGEWAWVLALLLVGLVGAGAGIRSSFRPARTWDAPLVMTPMGAFPPSLIASLSRGFDLLILCSLPVLLALLGLFPLTTPLLWAQFALTIVAIGVAQKLPVPASR